MTKLLMNATAADWNNWKQEGRNGTMTITRVVIEGELHGRKVKFDATEHYMDLAWPDRHEKEAE